jgi:Suppressor of fused protein (SUFU)
VRLLSGVDVRAAIDAHLRQGFPGQRVVVQGWNTQAIAAAQREVRVLRVDPETRGGLWLHVSSGAWGANQDSRVGQEFVLVTPYKTLRAVELLAMVVYYHLGQPLRVGDTVPIGEPWLPGSDCSALLISDPYLLADDLWTLPLFDQQIEFLWTLPITGRERSFVTQRGLEALEERFEAAGLEYWDPHRSSVI